MNLRQRSYQKELLDGQDIPAADIHRNMYELDVINTWLGGHAITISGVRQLIRDKGAIQICEIGCGGGDNLAAIQSWCWRSHINASFTGIDSNPDCIEVAKQQWQGNNSSWIVSPYQDVRFEQKPDIIFSSLFCHHFTREELIDQMQWMQQNARLGFFINDLHRHPLAWYAIKGLTQLFSRSYLVKHDAPLSVARSFVKNEWQDILLSAGITNFSIRWRWAFRWLIVVNEQRKKE